MEGTRNMVAVSFALIVVALYLISAIYIVNPFLSKNFIVLDDAVALYIDTLASVEEGSAVIHVEKGAVNKLEITYLKKGEEEGIEHDGWYAVATYRMIADKTEISASRINSYPFDAPANSNIFSPTEVCIIKERGSEYPRVSKC